ncbi:hypothetical protein AGLY_009091 [Aphis glycines]|uniref:RRM domain-containing protein n=1 Tax=Aphis glycines TaxID=307491 RepID=A0A6G0TIE2_APHGL|nr:hypothetical protein AGLY_009091 [Aphis glycines]
MSVDNILIINFRFLLITERAKVLQTQKGTRIEYSKRLEESTTMYVVYVGHLNLLSTEEDIHKLFSEAGKIKTIIMGLDKHKLTPGGFCFIEYVQFLILNKIFAFLTINYSLHTILLVQPGNDPETRICIGYNSLEECMNGICGFYEACLMNLNPTVTTFTYEIYQLFDFLDNLIHISCLVYQPDTMMYVQFDKQMIKVELFIQLGCQTNQRP